MNTNLRVLRKMVEVLLKIPVDLRWILKSEEDVKFLESAVIQKLCEIKIGDILAGKSKLKEENVEELDHLIKKGLFKAQKEVYLDRTHMAEELMVGLDITDSPFLALARTLNCQIWSKDGHFKHQNLVKVYTTKEILELLRR